MSQERPRRFAFGVFDTLQGTLSALGDHGRFRRGQVERVLRGILGNSPLRFVVVEQEGQRIFQAGDAPNALSLPTDTGEMLRDDVSIFWRKVRLQDDAEGVPPPEGTVSDAMFDVKLGAGDQTMVLGVGVPQDRPGPPPPMRGMSVTLIVILLFVGASTVAWVMAIRSGLLAEQLELERARRSRLEELGLAAAGLAHETKNPLGIIMGLSQQIARSPGVTPDDRVMLEHIIDEVDRATARLGSFMTFAQQREVQMTALEARTVVTKVAKVLKPDFDSAGVSLAVDCPPVKVLADEEMLSQVLVNLLLNSLHASSAGTTVTVRVASQGKSADLTVQDQGSGIEPELLPHIFKPYVSGRSEGHGLGLAVVKRFVEEQGWSVAVASQLQRGTTVTISGIRLCGQGEPEP
jgi:signal transduction histidine kinase